jgi:prepilin-type N-terminal cleavage/methylation domain-containing protein
MFEGQKGVTLTELLMVIVCLGILMAIAAPDWISRAWPVYRLKNAARQVVSDVRLARTRAVTANRQYRLRFDPSGDAYFLEKGDLPGGSANWAVEGSARRFGSAGGASFSGVEIAGDAEFCVVFSPTGTVTSATITLENTPGGKMAVVCSMAGRVRMVRL